MGATVVDTQTGVDGGGVGSIALSSFASNAQLGDTIVVSAVWFNDTAAHIADAGNAPTDNKGNTYAVVGTLQGPNNTGGLAYTQVFWKADNCAAGATNVTLHGTAGALRLGIAKLCRGLKTSGAYNGDYAGTNFTSFVSTATFPQTTATPAANSLFFCSMFRHSNGVSTAPAGWATRDYLAWATNAHIVMSTIVASAKQTPVWSIPDTDYWSGGTFSLAPIPPNPTPTSVTPNPGQTVGGEQVTIAGTSFTADTTFTFGGVSATGVIFDSAVQMRCTTPAGAVGAVDVIATNSLGSATLVGGYTYAVRPIPVSVMPQYGLNGHLSTATIKGLGFIGGCTVTFDGTPATSIVVVDSSTITCVPPAHADGTAVITITNP